MKVPIAEVKQSWADALTVLPVFSTVSIHPAWPGEPLLYSTNVPSAGSWKAAIWFGSSLPSYAQHSMRADRQRRIVTARFDVLIEVQVSGESNEAGAAALLAEQIAYDLWQPIDEHIADEKHLSRPDLVNSAVVEGGNPEAGFIDTGYGYRMAMTVAAEFRLL